MKKSKKLAKRTRTIAIFTAAIFMIGALITVLPKSKSWLKTDAASVTSASLTDMRARAESIVNYEWTPSQNIATWNGNSYNGSTVFKKGTTVKGMPYTLFTSEIVGDSLLSLSQYKNVASQNYSTTKYCKSAGATRTGPVYGSCCATFVSEIFGGSFMSGSNPRYDSVSAIEGSGYANHISNAKASQIQAGDALSKSGHIIWIGEVTDTTFVIYEQTPPIARKVVVKKSAAINSSGYLVYDGSVYKTITRINVTGGSASEPEPTPSFKFWTWEQGDKYSTEGTLNLNNLSDTVKVWMRQDNCGAGNDCDVNIYIDDKHKETIYCDEGGHYFSYCIDTQSLENGEHMFKAVLRTKSGLEFTITQAFTTNNPSFKFWTWEQGDKYSTEGTLNLNNLSDTVKIWMRQYNCGTRNDCDVNIYIDDKHLETIYCDEGGYFSYDIDTRSLENGEHMFKAVLRTKSGLEFTITQDFTTNNPSFKFWTWEQGDKYSTEGTLNLNNLSDTVKVWMRQDNCGAGNDCDVNIYIDDKHKETIYCDEGGHYFSYCIDTRILENGEHMFKAVLHAKSGLEFTITQDFTTNNEKAIIKAEKIELGSKKANVKIGSTLALTASVQPANTADTVTWKSSNTKIATVSASGQVKAVGLGRATITATAGKVSAACTVDVTPNISLKTLGASVRISDPYGIRFGIQLKKDSAYKSTDIAEYGTLIIASGTLGGGELTVDSKSVRKIPAKVIYSEDNSQLTYTGVLINIPKSFFGTNVKGRGYLIYRDVEGKQRVMYSEIAEKNFNGVAQAAYNSYSKFTNPTSEQKAVLNKLKTLLNK